MTCACVVVTVTFCSFIVVAFTRQPVELTLQAEEKTGGIRDTLYSRTYAKAGVATDAEECSNIGRLVT